MASIVGVLAMVVLFFFAGMSSAQAIFCGILLGGALWALLAIVICRDYPPISQVQTRVPGSAGTQAGSAGVGPGRFATPGGVGQSAPDSSPISGGEGSDDMRGGSGADVVDGGSVAASPAAGSGVAQQAGEAPAPAPDADEGSALDPVPATPVSGAPDEVVVSDADRPEALDGPRGGSADDLKQIKGIGPKLEKLCHRLGFYHFDQIAAWTDQEVAWVDQNLEGFKGRVTRDEWVPQAKILAEGGTTEFAQKVGKGGVY